MRPCTMSMSYHSEQDPPICESYYPAMICLCIHAGATISAVMAPLLGTCATTEVSTSMRATVPMTHSCSGKTVTHRSLALSGTRGIEEELQIPHEDQGVPL